MQSQRAGAMQQVEPSERPESALGGNDSQLSEVWSQSTEAVEEAGEDDTALPLGRVSECDTSTVGNVEDLPRRLVRPGGLRATVPRAQKSQRASSLAQRGGTRRGGNLT